MIKDLVWTCEGDCWIQLQEICTLKNLQLVNATVSYTSHVLVEMFNFTHRFELADKMFIL